MNRANTDTDATSESGDRPSERLVRDMRALIQDSEEFLRATSQDMEVKSQEARERMNEALEHAKETCGQFKSRAWNLTSLESLLAEELHDIYDAERQVAAALPEMAAVANHTELKEAFEGHRIQTEDQIKRLNEILEAAGINPPAHTCEAAQGLIEEAREIMEAEGDPSVKDAALIGAAQRIEHYEMAVYGTICALAKQLEMREVARLLHESLEEEKAADDTLTKLASGGLFSMSINKDAASSSSTV